MTRQRIEPTARQVTSLRRLVDSVPTINYHDWQSPQGRACLKAIVELQDRGVPLRWLTDALHVDAGPLYQALRKYERCSASGKDC